jgi:flagellar capping protein FliD
MNTIDERLVQLTNDVVKIEKDMQNVNKYLTRKINEMSELLMQIQEHSMRINTQLEIERATNDRKILQQNKVSTTTIK